MSNVKLLPLFSEQHCDTIRNDTAPNGPTVSISTDTSCAFLLSGIPNRHHLRPDMDRQSSQVQQHNENTDFKQQYGRTYLATRHHL